MKKILITGASGMVGTRLTKLLLAKGYEVNTLGRTKRTKQKAKVNSFVWNVEAGEIDAEAFEGVQAVIHLAGAGVADKRWSDARKEEIIKTYIQKNFGASTCFRLGFREISTAQFFQMSPPNVPIGGPL